MTQHCADCQYERVFEVRLESVAGDLSELKSRVSRLETTLARGVLLLVANLVGVLVTLAENLFRG